MQIEGGREREIEQESKTRKRAFQEREYVNRDWTQAL